MLTSEDESDFSESIGSATTAAPREPRPSGQLRKECLGAQQGNLRKARVLKCRANFLILREVAKTISGTKNPLDKVRLRSNFDLRQA